MTSQRASNSVCLCVCVIEGLRGRERGKKEKKTEGYWEGSDREKGERYIHTYMYICIHMYDVCPYRASDSSVPESSPLWNVGCFSLSARPQVRWRERRRCDYQPAALAVPGDEDRKLTASETRQLQQPQRTMQVIATGNWPGDHGNNNHQARVLIKRGDDGSPGDDECDQTQC